MKTNRAGVELIKRWESLRLNAYLCPAGIPTIGYGHTGDVKLGDKITAHQADSILDVDLDKFEREVELQTTGVKLNENEFSALVSFTYNLGAANLQRSALLRKLKAGAPRAEVAAEFGKWTKARDPKTGQLVDLPGLVKRREAERVLFLSVPA